MWLKKEGTGRITHEFLEGNRIILHKVNEENTVLRIMFKLKAVL